MSRRQRLWSSVKSFRRPRIGRSSTLDRHGSVVSSSHPSASAPRTRSAGRDERGPRARRRFLSCVLLGRAIRGLSVRDHIEIARVLSGQIECMPSPSVHARSYGTGVTSAPAQLEHEPTSRAQRVHRTASHRRSEAHSPPDLAAPTTGSWSTGPFQAPPRLEPASGQWRSRIPTPAAGSACSRYGRARPLLPASLLRFRAFGARVSRAP